MDFPPRKQRYPAGRLLSALTVPRKWVCKSRSWHYQLSIQHPREESLSSWCLSRQKLFLGAEYRNGFFSWVIVRIEGHGNATPNPGAADDAKDAAANAAIKPHTEPRPPAMQLPSRPWREREMGRSDAEGGAGARSGSQVEAPLAEVFNPGKLTKGGRRTIWRY